MKVLGTITSAALLAVAAAGVLVGIRSIPDVKRYLEMRRM